MSPSCPNLESILQGYRSFREKVEKNELPHLTDLATAQSPKVMIITCCDSRIELATLFGVQPGEIFVVRNVANVVPHQERDTSSHGVSAALEFAVKFLKVEHIIVLGHSNCGGIRALYKQDQKTEYIHKWVRHIHEAYERLISSGEEWKEEERLLSELEQENVALGIERLMEFDWIREAVVQGSLQLHGWYYEMKTLSLRKICASQNANGVVFDEGKPQKNKQFS